MSNFVGLFARRITIFLVLVLAATSLLTPSVYAAGTPTILSFQGRLADSSGNLLGGTGTNYFFKFSIWDSASSGSKLWPSGSPNSATSSVRQGVFNVNIGDTAAGYPDALTYNFNSASDIYLQIEVSSDNVTFQTLTPRQRITASAFARVAGAVSGAEYSSSFGTTTPFSGAQVAVEATSTNSLLLALRARASQVADLFQAQDSTGATLFSIDKNGGLFSASTINGSSTLGITGAANLFSTLRVGGALSASSTLGVTGATTLFSTLNVLGQTTLGSATSTNHTVSTLFNVQGTSTLATTTTTLFTATGQTSLTTASTTGLTVNGTTYHIGDILATTDVSRSIGTNALRFLNTFSQNIFASSSVITNATSTTSFATNFFGTNGTFNTGLTSNGTLNVTGQTTLGNASTTNLTVNGVAYHIGDILPTTDISRSLGANATRFLNLFSQNIFASSSVITNATSTTSFATNFFGTNGTFNTGLTSNGTLNVTGQTTLGNASSSALTVNGAALVAGTSTFATTSVTQLTATGQTSLTTASSTGLTINGTTYHIGDILATTDVARSIGSNAARFLNLFTQNIFASSSVITNASSTALTLGIGSSAAGRLYFANASNNFTTQLISSSTQASNLTFTLPGTNGTGGDVLTADGSGGMYWKASSGGALSGGTNGFLARWTSSNTLSIGTLLDNGTVSGVNATSSLYSFNVQAAAATNPFNVASSSGSSFFSIDTLGKLVFGNASSTNQTVSSLLNVQGTSTLATTTATGLTVTGQSSFANASTTNLTVNGITYHIGDILPTTDISRSLGTNALRFLNTFSQNVFASSSLITNATSTTSFATNFFGTNGTFNTALVSNGTLNVTGATVLGVASTSIITATTGFFSNGISTLATTTATLFTATGQSNLANASTTNLTVNGITYHVGDILPTTDVSRSFGTNALRFLNTFTQNIFASSSVITNASSTGMTLGIGSSAAGRLFFANASNNFTTQLVSSSTQAANLTFTLPGTSGAGGDVLKSDGSGGMYWSAAGGGSLSGGTNGFLARWTSASTLSSGLLMDNGTVAGVNATSSLYSFNVQASGGVNPFNVASSSGASVFNIDATGKLTFTNASSTSQTIAGLLDVDGVSTLATTTVTQFTASEQTTLANASTSALTVNGTTYVAGDILATTDIARSLGTNALRYLNAFVQNIFASSSVLGYASSTALSIRDSAGNADTFSVQNSSGVDVMNVDTNILPNLITNPSFEQNMNGWAVKGSAVLTLDTSSVGTPKFGKVHLKATSTAAGTDGARYFVPLKANQTYTFTVWARSFFGTFNLILGRQEQGIDLETGCVSTAFTATYTQISCSFTTPASVISATSSVFYRLVTTSVTSFAVDGATLVEGGTGLTFDIGGTGFKQESALSRITINGNNTGDINPWQMSANTLPAQREHAGSIVSNGFLYVVGGYDGSARQNTVYYSKMAADGSPGAWSTMATGITSNAVAQNRQYPAVTVANGYMYVVGGFDGTQANSSVLYSKLNSDGTTGIWYCQGTATAAGCGTAGLPVNQNGLPTARVAPSVVVSNGYMYILGGCTDSTATCGTPSSVNYYAKLRADGTTGPWTSTGALSAAKGMGNAVFANGGIYYIGGRATAATSSVDRATIASDGSLSAFSVIGTLGPARQESGVFVANGYIYVVGGSDGSTPARTSNVVYAKLAADGTLIAATTIINSLPAQRAGQGTLVANGYVYILGGCVFSSGACGTNQSSSIIYASVGPRTLIGGTLDLVGLTSQSLGDYGGAGALSAGNGRFIGDLKVDGYADFNNGISVDSALNLNAVGADPGQTVFNINNSLSNSIFSVQHMSTAFGSLATAGAFAQTLSYLGQEFNSDERFTATTANSIVGDDGRFNFRTTAVSGTYSTPRGINGVARLIYGATGVGSMVSFGTLTVNGNAVNTILKTSNLPVMQVKFIPVQSGGSLAATNDFFIGMMDTVTPPTANDTLPANGVFLWTNNTAPATGGTLVLQGVVRAASATIGTSVSCSGTYTFGNSITARIQVESATTSRFLVDFNAGDGINFTDCGVVTGTFPTAQLAPQFMVIHNDATARQFDVDYIRVWQDDPVDEVEGLEEITTEENASSTQPLLVEESVIEQIDENATSTSTSTSPFNAKLVLADLMTGMDPEAAAGGAVETLNTGRMIAGVEIVTPKLTADSVITNSLTVNGLMVTSVGTASTTLDVLGDATFFGRPYFTSDTGGSAVIKKGSKSVDVVFERDYIESPIINASIVFTASTTGETIEQMFANDTRFVIGNRTTKGFSIYLNKTSQEDITFNWVALAIKNSKEFTSKSADAEATNALPDPTASSTPEGSDTSTSTLPEEDTANASTTEDVIVPEEPPPETDPPGESVQSPLTEPTESPPEIITPSF